MCDFSEFIDKNDTFLLTFFGLFSSCVAGCLVYLLKSRCTRIKCGCVSCERVPVSETNLSSVSVVSSAAPVPSRNNIDPPI